MESIGHSSYLKQVFYPESLKYVVSRIHTKLKYIEGKGVPIDAIAFRGQSGAGVAYPLSARYGWKLACLRRSSAKSHGRRIEASDGIITSYVIVDDLIATGNTMDLIMEALGGAKCLGIILYYPDFARNRHYKDIRCYYVEIKT